MRLSIPNELTKLLAGRNGLAPFRPCGLRAMDQVSEGMRRTGTGMTVVVIDWYAQGIGVCLETHDFGVAREVALLDEIVVLTTPASS